MRTGLGAVCAVMLAACASQGEANPPARAAEPVAGEPQAPPAVDDTASVPCEVRDGKVTRKDDADELIDPDLR